MSFSKGPYVKHVSGIILNEKREWSHMRSFTFKYLIPMKIIMNIFILLRILRKILLTLKCHW